MAEPSIQSHTLDLGDLRLRYLAAGERGSPVVLLHGGGADSALLSWRHTIPALAEDHRVFAPDWPGYGESDRPDVAYTVSYLVSILARFLDALGLERASLAGLSMGGAAVLGYTLQEPRRVERLALVDSYGLSRFLPGGWLGYLYVRLPWINEFTWRLVARNRSAARASLRGIFHDPGAATDELVDEVMEELGRSHVGRAFRSFQRHELGWSGLRTVYTDRLHEIQAPTLLIHGANDRLVPLASVREAQRLIPGARLAIVPDAGHWPQREQPETFNCIITGFMSEDGSGAPVA